VVYKPIRTEAYRTRGDTPGTMGVDFQGPQYIPATETPRWVRICPNCGLEEETRQARDEVKKVPVFR
jgi:hypothetical protein